MEVILEVMIGSILLLGIAVCFLKAMAKLDGDYKKESQPDNDDDLIW